MYCIKTSVQLTVWTVARLKLRVCLGERVEKGPTPLPSRLERSKNISPSLQKGWKSKKKTKDPLTMTTSGQVDIFCPDTGKGHRF